MNFLKKTCILAAMVLMIVPQSIAQNNGYNIKITVEGVRDSLIYLANYFGDKQYIKDSTHADINGSFTFKGKEALPGGIYLVVLPAKKYFEVIVDKKQQFNMRTKMADPIAHMNVDGSEENKQFYVYLNFVQGKQKELEPIRMAYERVKENNPDSAEYYRSKLSDIDLEVKNYKLDYIKKYPDQFISKVFLASSEPEVPEAPKNVQGQVDSTFAYKYYKEHYWDHIDLQDDRLIRTPVYHNKLVSYMKNLTPQIPDSIIESAEYLLNKTKGTKDLFKYTIHYITYTYETSNVMGMDAVFVHMVDTYYKPEIVTWIDSTQLYKITERAKVLRPILIGKPAPNLVMKDLNNQWRSLKDVKAKYTVVYFWDPDCSHCKKVTPLAIEYYHKVKNKGVEFYAVCTEVELDKWRIYIKEHNLDWINVADPEFRTNFRYYYDLISTPMIYLLDENKHIIMKRIGVETLEQYLNDKLQIKP